MHRQEKQTAIAAGAVGFGADQDRSVKGIEDISVRKDESYDLGLALPVQLKVEFRGSL